MIHEEYNFEDIAEYLYSDIDLLIAGIPTSEERSRFFIEQWKAKGKMVLQVWRENNDMLTYHCFLGNQSISEGTIDLW